MPLAGQIEQLGVECSGIGVAARGQRRIGVAVVRLQYAAGANFGEPIPDGLYPLRRRFGIRKNSEFPSFDLVIEDGEPTADQALVYVARRPDFSAFSAPQFRGHASKVADR